MLIRRPRFEVPASEITAEALVLNRRALMGAGAALLPAAALAQGAPALPESLACDLIKPDVMAVEHAPNDCTGRKVSTNGAPAVNAFEPLLGETDCTACPRMERGGFAASAATSLLVSARR